MSFGKSDISVKAGLSSGPEASDKPTSSKGFLGVVKAGLRNGAAVGLEAILGWKIEAWGGGTANVVAGLRLVNGFGRASGLDGELKTRGKHWSRRLGRRTR